MPYDSFGCATHRLALNLTVCRSHTPKMTGFGIMLRSARVRSYLTALNEFYTLHQKTNAVHRSMDGETERQ